MHFVKFETARIDDCIDFIEAKGLHRTLNGAGKPEGKVRIVATGGGAFKYADKFQVGGQHLSGIPESPTIHNHVIFIVVHGLAAMCAMPLEACERL